MPRAAKTSSTRKHAAAAPLKRAYAVPDAQVSESVLPGSAPELVLAAVAAPEPPKPLETSQFYGAIRAGAAAHPYSRSHLRREKRKAKDQLAGGMAAVASALAAVSGEQVEDLVKPVKKSAKEIREEKEAAALAERKRREEEGKIGQGRGKGIKEKQRRRQIAANAMRIPAVMSHPAFKANPWATIREHASNSLAASEEANAVVERKRRDEAARNDPKDKVRIPESMKGMEVE